MVGGRHDLPVPARRGPHLPALRRELLRLPAIPLEFDMDRWEGLAYGRHPAQVLDAWECNDFAPREGWPAVLLLHGGGWVAGHRHDLRVFGPRLARHGLLVAAAGYRLAPEHRWPAALEDVLAACQRLRGMQVDPERIALWGWSAGGHLALCAARELGPERLRCVVAVGAPTDLPALSAAGFPHLGRVFDPEDLAAASPARDPRPLPPVLLLHGERDRAVPAEQAERLARAAPDAVTLRLVPGADHALRRPRRASRRALAEARRWLLERLADRPRRSKWRVRRQADRRP